MTRTMDSTGAALEVLFERGSLGDDGDGRLLDRFATARDEEAEAAFRVLVARHGPMVLGVCRRILGDEHDAQDAAQAVFLILARRAGAIRSRESAAGWLYRVARRTALRLRRETARRREVAWNDGADASSPDAASHAERTEARDGIHQELDRLPERYRSALILCHLEGLTCEQASRRLRCAARTVETRLHRGRARLRERLLRRGLAPSLVLAALAREASAAPPSSWVQGTIRASLAFAQSPRSVAIAQATAAGPLALGVLKMMSIRQAATTVAASLAFGILAAGGLWAHGVAQDAPKPPRTTAPQPPKKAETKELALDDGKDAGRRSIGGSGHAVRFEAPNDASTLVKVKVHGARYGTPRPPREDFIVFLCDDKFQKLAEFPFRYEKFERGDAKWVTLDVSPTKLPKTFYLGVDFDPGPTKGVYVSHDDKKSDRSVVGLPGEKPEPFEKGNWMIRAVLAPES
ncbi:RNA polymerase sigma factor [Paludisphaera rhizosphaerae]|uniref:RNA polymerase sigma factor n=1 Tax=Paludisphaera rhizosphaerae TaxID=2711216 RepID=UPI0013EBD365|nr:RNA polymerase sigma factor [Paludisphaera rhizosphaerae]